MMRREFYKRFTPEEWELLCSKIEFLDVFAEEPFNAEQAEAAADRILNSNPPPNRKPLETEDGLEE